MFVKERFELDPTTVDRLYSMTPSFGYNGFGEFIFYRTYSRSVCSKCKKQIKYHPINRVEYCDKHGEDFECGQETWADCVRRVVEGTFSIRKDWYLKNHISWDEDFWQHYALHFAISLFKMQWSPPGRGLWAMGTNFVYERGAMALANCGFTTIDWDIGKDISWLMDVMMCGTGAGFNPIRNDNLKIYNPKGSFEYIIPDTREGWCKATELLINSYLHKGRNAVKLIYDLIRKEGEPIRGFGGTASGPKPLIEYHQQIRNFFDMFGCNSWYDSVMLKADIANAAGCCIISGNVRRSAELLCGEYDDIMDLKDYSKYPHRERHGWMSNNSVLLKEDSDFERLSDIADRVKKNGEPGVINLQNIIFGRIGKPLNGLRLDKAIGYNPCSEMSLENKELCNVIEDYPTRCESDEELMKAFEYATMYGSTVTLLPTHCLETNAVMLRNRRIGVSITDVSAWEHKIGTTKMIKNLREGYNKVRATNEWANNEAGVPLAVRHTTIKPSGSVSKLPGVRSGMHWPTFAHTLRRVRVAQNSSVYKILDQANVPHEPDRFSANTEVFEWPIDQSEVDGVSGVIQPATEVSLWRQAMMLVLLQREWSDNAVSNTLYFKPKWPLIRIINLGPSFYDCFIPANIFMLIESLLPISWEDFLEVQDYEASGHRFKLEQDRWSNDWLLKIYKYDENHEEDQVEPVLAAIAPLTKSVSMLPHSANGVYIQTPEEGISKEEFDFRLSKMKKIDWSKLSGSDGQDEKYCQGPSCEIPR